MSTSIEFRIRFPLCGLSVEKSVFFTQFSTYPCERAIYFILFMDNFFFGMPDKHSSFTT